MLILASVLIVQIRFQRQPTNRGRTSGEEDSDSANCCQSTLQPKTNNNCKRVQRIWLVILYVCELCEEISVADLPLQVWIKFGHDVEQVIFC